MPKAASPGGEDIEIGEKKRYSPRRHELLRAVPHSLHDQRRRLSVANGKISRRARKSARLQESLKLVLVAVDVMLRKYGSRVDYPSETAHDVEWIFRLDCVFTRYGTLLNEEIHHGHAIFVCH